MNFKYHNSPPPPLVFGITWLTFYSPPMISIDLASIAAERCLGVMIVEILDDNRPPPLYSSEPLDVIPPLSPPPSVTGHQRLDVLLYFPRDTMCMIKLGFQTYEYLVHISHLTCSVLV